MNVKAPKSVRPLLELERFLPYRLNVVAESVSRALSRLYAERYGIGVPEWRVMATLGEYERMTAKQVGAHSRMHKTKVSRAVAALESKGLIEREPNEEDMREAFLALTGRGLRVYQDLAPRALAFEGALDKTLGSGERAHLDAILRRLEERAQELADDLVRGGST
jgi:DNA-binding MarR family transcriptional regulator